MRPVVLFLLRHNIVKVYTMLWQVFYQYDDRRIKNWHVNMLISPHKEGGAMARFTAFAFAFSFASIYYYVYFLR